MGQPGAVRPSAATPAAASATRLQNSFVCLSVSVFSSPFITNVQKQQLLLFFFPEERDLELSLKKQENAHRTADLHGVLLSIRIEGCLAYSIPLFSPWPKPLSSLVSNHYSTRTILLKTGQVFERPRPPLFLLPPGYVIPSQSHALHSWPCEKSLHIYRVFHFIYRVFYLLFNLLPACQEVTILAGISCWVL